MPVEKDNFTEAKEFVYEGVNKVTGAVKEVARNFTSKECSEERNEMNYHCRNSYDNFGLLGNGKCKILETEYYQCRDKNRLKNGR
jgi:hypothetical protein